VAALAGKRCLITGASGGLGEELARKFGGLGCRLILTGRTEKKLRAVAERLESSARVENCVAADFRVKADLEELIESVVTTIGGLDVLINNAGVFPVGSLDTLSPAELDECLDVNLRSAILLCRAFAPAMAKAGWGRIVNIASSSAYAGFANTAAYCASKHGLLGFSRALDDELRGRGVRVIAVSPGSIKTPMGRKVRGQTYETFMDPREVADVIGDVASLDGSIVISEVRLGRAVMG
jgi:NAD(P)-dependent dehydrogenase (short-subunit alcohol dehydrogenase family)